MATFCLTFNTYPLSVLGDVWVEYDYDSLNLTFMGNEPKLKIAKGDVLDKDAFQEKLNYFEKNMVTTKPFLTLQQILDIVVKHLLTQAEQSLDPDNSFCMYRGPRGLKCAVGILIREDLYDVNMENQPVGALFTQWHDVIVGSGIDADDMDACIMLNELQQIHDPDPVPAWEFSLKELADKHGLSFNPN